MPADLEFMERTYITKFLELQFEFLGAAGQDRMLCLHSTNGERASNPNLSLPSNKELRRKKQPTFIERLKQPSTQNMSQRHSLGFRCESGLAFYVSRRRVGLQSEILNIPE